MGVNTDIGADRSVLSGTVDDDSPRPPPFMQQFDVIEFCRTLWRQRWTIIVTILAIMILGAVAIFSLTPRYTATSYVEISPRQARVVDFDAVLSGLPADVATMETEIEILRSRSLARKTIDELDLERLPEFNPALRAPNLFTMMLFTGEQSRQRSIENSGGDDVITLPKESGSWIDSVLQSAIAYFQNSLNPDSKDLEFSSESFEHRVAKERSGTVDIFLSRLTILPRGRSRVIALSFESENPGIAATAANTLAEFYIVSQLEAKFEAAQRANAWLNDRITQLRKEVAAAEQSVEEFRGQSGLIQGGTNATLAGEQVSELNTQFVMERTRLAEAEARLRQAERLLGSPNAIETAGEVLNSQIIRDLRREETEVERRVAELSTEYGERHPRMINARAELQDVQEKIRGEVQKIIQSLRNEVAVARARSGALNSALNRMKQEIAGLNESEVQLRALEREASASRTLLEQLLARSKETASQADFQQADATIITEAPIPELPSYPNKSLMLVALFVFAAVSGLSAALLVERMDYGFRSTDQLERQFGHSALGLVPTVGGLKSIGRNPSDYVLDKPLSAYSEAVRNAYTNLLLADVGREFKTILITSALPNEGKTSIVVSLARLLSNQGLKVVVVDCDLRKPSLHKIFSAAATPGIAECLTGEVALDAAMAKDKKSGVHFLSAGKAPANPTTLLDSISTQKLLKALSREYDLVLVDSAPVLAVSDTLFLGRLMDKTILVVRWARTRRESVELAVKKLTEAHCKVSGILLSMVDTKGHATYGYSDSGIYHGELRRYYTG